MIVIDGVNDILRLKYATLRDPSACNTKWSHDTTKTRRASTDAHKDVRKLSRMMIGLICPALGEGSGEPSKILQVSSE